MTEPFEKGNVLRGAREISTFLFGSPKHTRKVYHLRKAKKSSPPMFNLGSVIYARKSEILKWVETQEKKGGGHD